MQIHLSLQFGNYCSSSVVFLSKHWLWTMYEIPYVCEKRQAKFVPITKCIRSHVFEKSQEIGFASIPKKCQLVKSRSAHWWVSFLHLHVEIIKKQIAMKYDIKFHRKWPVPDPCTVSSVEIQFQILNIPFYRSGMKKGRGNVEGDQISGRIWNLIVACTYIYWRIWLNSCLACVYLLISVFFSLPCLNVAHTIYSHQNKLQCRCCSDKKKMLNSHWYVCVHVDCALL